MDTKNFVEPYNPSDIRKLPETVIEALYDGWYFWDEDWCRQIGPYETREAAELALKNHAINLMYGGFEHEQD